ncbi:hypothetical protein FACS189459_0520 [Bacilli bacterium]|nr:hypothetical protein FACS189459_0520 [Bacilli bacterium]
MNKFLLSDMEKMFDYISTNNENVESFIIQSKHKLITGINFIIYDISIDSKVLVEIIKYFKKNKINYDDFDGYIKFRIATIEPKYIKKFNKQIENISSKEKTEIALSFDKQVTLPNLFGIGYEKDGMTPEGTKIRFAIRDMLLKISGLDKSVSITKDG